ncbi:LysR substrate-binding domain-containing protein [Nonomuraea roseoviolacea subsp. roseoviolacea]|uniref:DNA-binding transcriptional LysR family regulator n=1 Tax=Nonomuraea roseoviolacea subsp. carminata TaxID=160689 RepID=A0ABT1JZ92_9ACTN|nr:LysR substrate-binding domain-containing protein [Nonomuraea roseoviolacea]MCP2346566.1 DNA-binding transcriptional LysR family regulator [Nonomuraea roseoviolacea subsp. carminata]
MELRQLAYFVAVAEEASFTRAAASLHVAQPGVSAQIRQLERELGQPLFDRSARAVRLTAAGEAVLPYARAALKAVAGARQVVDELTGLLRGHVVMGAVSLPGALDVPGLLADFHDAHPAVEITLKEADPETVVQEVRSGRMDLGLFGLGPGVPPGLDAQIVVSQPLVAAVSRDHELAGRPGIGLAELEGRALLCLPPGTGLRAALEEACAAAGFRPRVSLEASEPPVLARLAARGLGVAVLPESAVSVAEDLLHVMELTRPRLRGRMAIAWRSEGEASPAARALIAHARRTLPDLGLD